MTRTCSYIAQLQERSKQGLGRINPYVVGAGRALIVGGSEKLSMG